MRDSHTIINQLSPSDALAVLKTLARDDEALAARIAEVAIAHLNELEPEEVASVLYDELDALEV